MKTLTTNALTEIAKQYATEPVTIVEIEWVAGSVSQYADKAILGIDGKILSVGNLESALTIQKAQTAQVPISLDDTSGEIKRILDQTDIHKKLATVYQWYGGLVDADKFVVFKGQISTPFEWKEKARSIDFTILSQVESYQIGFSPEEGQLDFVASDLEGQSWPLAIGRVKHVPAKKVSQKKVAFLLEAFGRVDITLYQRLRDLEADYGRESFMLHFWILVMRGANAIAPDVSWILNEYVKAIINEDRIRPTVLALLALLTRVRRVAQRFANAGAVARGIRTQIRQIQNALQIMAAAANAIFIRKKVLQEMCRLAEFEYEQKKRAAQNQINTYNKMREIHADYLAVWKEICRQSQLLKTCVKTKDGAEIFGAGADVDVIIHKVRFRVQFDTDDVMCYVAGPLAYDKDIAVDAWKPDDDPCSGIEDIDGANLFWLEATIDVNGDPESIPQLEDTWILVKKRGTDDSDGSKDRHILKVTKQVGLKIYFELVEWDKGGSGGFPRGMNLANIVREIVDTPLYPGPFGYWYPEGFFTGDYDPNIWNRPEAEMLLSILRATGPVSKDELTTLTKLVYLLPNDILGDTVFAVAPGLRDIYTIIGSDVGEVVEVSGLIPENWLTRYSIPYEELPESMFWKADSGSRIEEDGPDCDIYIANILPSTVKSVSAYRTNEDGLRFLAPVPSRYYIKNESANLGSIDVTSLTFPTSLVLIPGENWEEVVYVSLISPVGPSVVDYIQYIVETYTDKTVNASNFAAIKAKLQNGGEELYPVDFCTFERPDALEEIRRTAWEARLGVLLINDEMFLKYLSEEPSQDTTLDEGDFELDSLKIAYTRTEELVTVLTSTYKIDYLELEQGEEDPKVILRHNVKKYGAHQSEEFFHIYTDRELVLKSATFWLIRYSNTWKKVHVSVFHSRLNVDTLDTVLLQLSSTFVSNADVKCVVEEAVFDSVSNLVEFVLHTGIRAGEMDQYKFFWPALGSDEFPTAAEITEGNAGGFGPGSVVTGTIGDCPES